ncbi:hypothetical protein [Pandoraea anhela]|uniref:Uncharacterized protein n=1 Tax=Pandoraea anhela TaxID=2508295 RepID=A0A5E4ULA4_9BURK|nr:hypothetical protein [Pandoraea anhela]VVE00737.1 hypothetical protein PAN31108_02116 [Pandoraea anhela]
MIYRNQGQIARAYFDAAVTPGAWSHASRPPPRSSPSSLSDNPMLSAIAVADAQLGALQGQADAWLANVRARNADARESDASSTIDQIHLKRLVTRYDNTLTLYNAVVSKLGEIVKKIVSSF